MEDNFTLIATNTTKYYLELDRNYRDRFKNEASLLSAVGLLDAQNYIFIEKTIDLSSVLNMAREVSSNKENALVEFITRLEIAIFQVDNPSVVQADIVDACINKKEDIANAVQRVKEEYLSDPLFSAVVSEFMNSAQFKPYRQILDIAN